MNQMERSGNSILTAQARTDFGCDSVVTVLTTLTLVGTVPPRPESIGSDEERSPAVRWLARGLVTTDDDPGGEADA